MTTATITSADAKALIAEQLAAIRKAAENPNPVDVQVDIDSGSRTAQIEITKRGL